MTPPRFEPEDLDAALRSARIGVAIPAYEEERQIAAVLRGIPDFVDVIVVVDDGSSDGTSARVRALDDPRVTLIRHEENRGIGAAVCTAFEEALRRDCEVVVKMDGDGQMDPRYLPRLLEPVIAGRADVAKANRYAHLAELQQMPLPRLVGNAALTFLVKAASGYWRSFDPTNGYIALNAQTVRELNERPLARDYFFESGLLIELGILRAVVETVPVPAVYGSESSNLSIMRVLAGFPPRLLRGFLRRVFWRYVVHDFSAVSVMLLLGFPLFALGVAFGAALWWQSLATGEYTAAGPVMLAAMPMILGFQMLLQAVVLDIANVPVALTSSTPWLARVPLEAGADEYVPVRPSAPNQPRVRAPGPR